jgi:hypothetical protein
MDRSDMRSSAVADVGTAHRTPLHGRAEGPVVGQRALHPCSREIAGPSGRAAHRSRLNNHTHGRIGSVRASADNNQLESFTRAYLREPSTSWRGQ